MIQLNLLPDVKKEFLRAESARRKTIAVAIFITIVAVGLTALIAFYVYAVQNVIIYAQTQDIKNKSSELSKVKDIDKYLTIQNQLANLSSLHGEKNNFSRLLDFLPKLNPAPPRNIVLSNLEVDSKETMIVFKGKVSSYGALTTFKDTLTNADVTYRKPQAAEDTKTKLFKEVRIDAAVFEKNDRSAGVNFSVSVIYDPAIFKQDNTQVNVTVPNVETTGSVVGSPQAIFGGNQ